jgi:hypothetical protein
MKRLGDYIEKYRSSEVANDDVWSDFTALTDSIPYLKEHRDWVEKSKWGFGDRAFHYMWYLLLNQEIFRSDHPSMLEIGVYKGQVISLWSLIATRANRAANIYAISPLRGNPRYPYVFHQAMRLLSQKYRDDIRAGNRYDHEDYLSCIKRIFAEFHLDFSMVNMLRGYSNEAKVKQKVAPVIFDLVYVDGGHTYVEVAQDLSFYGDKIKIGGYLVLDDASYYQPGTKFYKGYKSVSDAAEELNKRKFRNVLNVGHNRIFRRIS